MHIFLSLCNFRCDDQDIKDLIHSGIGEQFATIDTFNTDEKKKFLTLS